jgi:hypothetical protein
MPELIRLNLANKQQGWLGSSMLPFFGSMLPFFGSMLPFFGSMFPLFWQRVLYYGTNFGGLLTKT